MQKPCLNILEVENYVLQKYVCNFGHSTQVITLKHLQRALASDTRMLPRYAGIEFATFPLKTIYSNYDIMNFCAHL